MRVLPPEAYTNRELAQAYSWLMNQPEHIQRLGTTKEAVISLFKRAVRGGEPKVGDSPTMNSETFQADLKNLADVARTFEAPPAPRQQPTNLHQNSNHNSNHNSHSNFYHGNSNTTNANQSIGLELDEKSWKMIQMVKAELNLSQDMEALRLLIKLGFEKVAIVLPSASI